MPLSVSRSTEISYRLSSTTLKDLEVACWVVHGMNSSFNSINQLMTYFSRSALPPPKCTVPEDDPKPLVDALAGVEETDRWGDVSARFCEILIAMGKPDNTLQEQQDHHPQIPGFQTKITVKEQWSVF